MSDDELIRRAEKKARGLEPWWGRDIMILRWALDKPCAPSDDRNDHKRAEFFMDDAMRCPVCRRAWRFMWVGFDKAWVLWDYDDDTRAMGLNVPDARARLTKYVQEQEGGA